MACILTFRPDGNIPNKFRFLVELYLDEKPNHCLVRLEKLFSLQRWSWFYESSQAMPTYRRYFD